MTATTRRPEQTGWQRLTRRAGGGLLWATAVLGVLSVFGAIAATAFNVQPLVFRSGSMAPEIQAGALALATTEPAEAVARGDVVSVADAEGRRVTHRVVSAEPSATEPGALDLTLQGDANPAPDAEPYTVSEVDRVVLDVPWLGYPVSWLSGPWAAFLAGVVATAVLLLVLRRPAGRRRGGVAAVSVLAASLVVPTAGPDGVAGTDAAFSDVANFRAGVMAAHRVRAFDLNYDQFPSACENLGNTIGDTQFHPSVSIKWKTRDRRYETIWTSPTSPGLRTGAKVVPQTGAPQTPASTTFTSAANNNPTPDILSSTTGTPITIEGRSRLIRATSWVSEDARVEQIDRGVGANGGVRCAGAEVQPTLTIAQPAAGTATRSEGVVREAIRVNCVNGTVSAACGTAQASGNKTITSVDYELRRAGPFQGTQCWNGSSYGTGNCGVWRAATLTGTPASTWRVPASNNPYERALFTASYTLTVRATDSSGQTFVQIRTINVSP